MRAFRLTVPWCMLVCVLCAGRIVLYSYTWIQRVSGHTSIVMHEHPETTCDMVRHDYTGCEDGNVLAWDHGTGALVHTYRGTQWRLHHQTLFGVVVSDVLTSCSHFSVMCLFRAYMLVLTSLDRLAVWCGRAHQATRVLCKPYDGIHSAPCLCLAARSSAFGPANR